MKSVRSFLALAAALLLAGVVPLLSGCETFRKNQTGASLVVQYATAKVIESGKTDEARLAKADRIKAIATDARTWLDGESVTIDFLQSAAQARIAKLNLGTADLLLANALLTTVMQELQAKIGAGVIPPDKLTTVNQLLGWIITAAELYGA